MTDETQAAGPQVTAHDELKAMAAVDGALDALGDRDTKQRVIDWVSRRHGLSSVPASRRGAVDRSTEVLGADRGGDEEATEGYADFADMYNIANPRNDRERLLTAGWWHQIRLKEQDLNADNVNEILVPLGHGIKRVRDVLPTLLDAPAGSPRLVIRVAKGKGIRGRVTFRLTTAGIGAVNRALAAGGFANAE